MTKNYGSPSYIYNVKDENKMKGSIAPNSSTRLENIEKVY